MENFLRFNTLMENIYLGDDSLHCTPETDTYELSWSQTVTLIGDLIILIAALQSLKSSERHKSLEIPNVDQTRELRLNVNKQICDTI